MGKLGKLVQSCSGLPKAQHQRSTRASQSKHHSDVETPPDEANKCAKAARVDRTAASESQLPSWGTGQCPFGHGTQLSLQTHAKPSKVNALHDFAISFGCEEKKDEENGTEQLTDVHDCAVGAIPPVSMTGQCPFRHGTVYGTSIVWLPPIEYSHVLSQRLFFSQLMHKNILVLWRLL